MEPYSPIIPQGISVFHAANGRENPKSGYKQLCALQFSSGSFPKVQPPLLQVHTAEMLSIKSTILTPFLVHFGISCENHCQFGSV